MSKGFAKVDPAHLEAVKRRLIACMANLDPVLNTGRTIARLRERYGSHTVDAAIDDICQNPEQLSEDVRQTFARWGFEKAIKDPEMRDEVLSQSYDIIASVIKDSGLSPIWHHIRASERGFAVSSPAWKAIEATGFPAIEQIPHNETLTGYGLSRDPYWHPLSEVDSTNEWMNLYAMVSLMLDTILFNSFDGDPEKSKQTLRAIIEPVAPTLDLNKALERAVYDDRWLLKLTTLGVQGAEASIVIKQD